MWPYSDDEALWLTPGQQAGQATPGKTGETANDNRPLRPGDEAHAMSPTVSPSLILRGRRRLGLVLPPPGPGGDID